MRKQIIFIAIAFFSIGIVQAQDITFGAKAGINLSSAFGDSVNNVSGQTDFHIGGLANIELISWLALQPEVVYSRQGFGTDQFGIDTTVQLDYINVPVLVDFKIFKGFSLQGGPQFSFNLSSEGETNGAPFDFDAKSVLIGNAIGAQYKLPVTSLFFQLRYASDFVSAFDQDNTDVFNSTYSVSVGWFFD